MEAATGKTDLYNVDGYPFCSSACPRSHSRKRPVSSQDIFVYIMLKFLGLHKEPYTCAFMLNREMYIPKSVIKVIERATETCNIILVVEDKVGHMVLSMYYKKFKLVSELRSEHELLNILSNLSRSSQLSTLIYPLARDIDVRFVNLVNPSLWCFPISKHSTVVSSGGKDSCSHFVFPWSKVGMCTGYSMGSKQARVGSNSDNLEYESKCNFYDNMVSCVPVRGSCTDCIEMDNTARKLLEILQIKDTPKRKRPLSQESITALEELKAAIEAYTRNAS